MKEFSVVGDVEEGTQTRGAAWALDSPFAALGVDVAGPVAHRADCLPHLLLEGGGHRLLALLGEADADNVPDASPLHVLDDVVTDAGLVSINGLNHSPVVL